MQQATTAQQAQYLAAAQTLQQATLQAYNAVLALLQAADLLATHAQATAMQKHNVTVLASMLNKAHNALDDASITASYITHADDE
jgi:predicted hydrolase (HD superfamily)